MSSSSSYLIIGASAMGENIFRGLLHRKATDKQVMIVARVTLVVMFLFGILVAYDQNSSIDVYKRQRLSRCPRTRAS